MQAAGGPFPGSVADDLLQDILQRPGLVAKGGCSSRCSSQTAARRVDGGVSAARPVLRSQVP